MSWKTSQKTLTCFFVVVVIVLNQFLPLMLSLLTFSCLLKKLNKAARNLDASTSKRLKSNWWKFLIAMEHPKLKDIKSSAVIHQVCTEFCSRCVTKCICTSCLCCCSLCVALSVIFYICVTCCDLDVTIKLSETAQERTKGNNNGLSHVPSKKKKKKEIRNLWLWLVCCSLLPPCYFHRPSTSGADEQDWK